MDNRIAVLRQIFNKTNAENDISNFGKAIEFYIATGYEKFLTPEEIEDELKRYENGQPTRANFNNYFDNVITNGYFTHSFNGYALEYYRKNGIGAKFYDQELSENFAILEKFLGASRYVSKYAKTIPEFYITSPGNNSIYYALMQSPERLWTGPLSQRDDPDPVILPVVGETKSQYAMRIVEHKIAKRNISEEDAVKVRKSAKIIFDKLCTTNPMIAFIPTNLLMNCYVMKSVINISCDLGKHEDIDKTIKIIKEKYSNFVAVINCAAIVAMEKINEITYSKFERAFKINTIAPLYFMSSLYGNIVSNEADIINIGTTAFAPMKAGFSDQLAYTATKYGLRGGSYNFGLELKTTQSRVIHINLGGMNTKMHEKDYGLKVEDPNARMNPKDVADIVLYLINLPKQIEISEITINRKGRRLS